MQRNNNLQRHYVVPQITLLSPNVELPQPDVRHSGIYQTGSQYLGQDWAPHNLLPHHRERNHDQQWGVAERNGTEPGKTDQANNIKFTYSCKLETKKKKMK